MIGAISLLVYAVAIVFNVFEAISAFAQSFEEYQVNELFTLILVLLVATVVFAMRRWRELSLELDLENARRGGGSTTARRQEEVEPQEEDQQQQRQRSSQVSVDTNILVRADSRGRVIEANEGMQAATGLAGEQMVGTDAFRYFRDPGQVRSWFAQALDQGSTSSHETEILHHNGGSTPVTYSVTAQMSSDGELAGGIVICRPR